MSSQSAHSARLFDHLVGDAPPINSPEAHQRMVGAFQARYASFIDGKSDFASLVPKEVERSGLIWRGPVDSEVAELARIARICCGTQHNWNQIEEMVLCALRVLEIAPEYIAEQMELERGDDEIAIYLDGEALTPMGPDDYLALYGAVGLLSRVLLGEDSWRLTSAARLKQSRIPDFDLRGFDGAQIMAAYALMLFDQAAHGRAKGEQANPTRWLASGSRALTLAAMDRQLRVAVDAATKAEVDQRIRDRARERGQKGLEARHAKSRDVRQKILELYAEGLKQKKFQSHRDAAIKLAQTVIDLEKAAGIPNREDSAWRRAYDWIREHNQGNEPPQDQ